MDVKLSVIIPSIGRDTLERAKASCAGADEVIVIENSDGDHGYSARTRGAAQATGTHLAYMDDDDVYLPSAIETMRAHATDRPVIFKMDHYAHGILWRNPVLEFGNVSTQMFVVPNVPEKLGVWAPHMPGVKEPGGDFTFLAGCAEKMGDPVWRPEIIAQLRPPQGPSVAVVTPWLNHPELAPDYAVAVRELRSSYGDELIVIDNGSAERPPFPGIRLEENQGFVGACNRGLENASVEAVLFLNNDIAPIAAGWLEPLRAALEPGVLVGARLRYDSHGSIDGQPLPYLDGWCLAGMRDDLLELGGFDEDYQEPSYYSDNDLCLRARAAGMSLREVRVGLHHKLNTTARDNQDAVTAATLANRERFGRLARELLDPVAA